ncbi:MAG: Flp pilus assembly protein CpaB [Gaiellaceae bacterium]|jgi:Flp pilus assembly protein CpaB
MTYRVKNIGIAVILAAFAGLLTIFYVANYKRHVQHGEKNVSVLVAARDIPAGTTGSEVVEQHYLKEATVARRSVVPGAISKPDQLNSLVVTQQVFRGEQVTARSFGTRTELGVRAQIRGNERAFELPGGANDLLAGTIKEGDHIDVVANWLSPEGGETHVSKVILRNLLVLRAPEEPSSSAKLAGPNQDFSIQLRVTDAQSQKLYWAEQNGKLSLELRPPADSTDSPRSIDNARTLGVTR